MDAPASITGEAAAFENDPIDAHGLPRLDEHPFEPLDPAYARVRSIAAGAVALAVAAATALGAIASSSWIPLAVGAIVLGAVIVTGVAQRVEADHMAYLLREHDLSFRTGVIGRSVATAPFARVQHVSIERGPIDRRFGLATLRLGTAGGQISVPGLRSDVAERLKELVADRAGALADAETEAPLVAVEHPPD